MDNPQYTKAELQAHFKAMPHGPGVIPKIRELMGYLLRTEPQSVMVQIKQHLEGCEKCRIVVKAMSRSFRDISKSA